MSTEYILYKYDGRLEFSMEERSSKVAYTMYSEGEYYACTAYLTSDELREIIIKQIEVLSYISNDAEEVLKRFNVEYGDTR